jgi:hypothetical protein
LPQDQTNRNRLKRGLQSALADMDIDTNQCGSQAECDSTLHRAAIFKPFAGKFLLLMPQFPDKDRALRSFIPAAFRREI